MLTCCRWRVKLSVERCARTQKPNEELQEQMALVHTAHDENHKELLNMLPNSFEPPEMMLRKQQ